MCTWVFLPLTPESSSRRQPRRRNCAPSFFLRQQKAKLFHASQTFLILNNFFFLHFGQTAIELFQGGLIAICVNALDVHIIYTACTTRFSNLFLRASQFYSHNAIVYSIALYIHTVETLKI